MNENPKPLFVKSHFTPPVRTVRRQRKVSNLSLLLWLYSVLQYGVVGFFLYADAQWIAAAIVCVLFLMQAIGSGIVSAALKRIRQPALIEQWSAFAALLALPSLVVYALIATMLDRLRLDPEYPMPDKLSYCIVFVAAIVGYFMPFILSVLWLRYRHRTDEF